MTFLSCARCSPWVLSTYTVTETSSLCAFATVLKTMLISRKLNRNCGESRSRAALKKRVIVNPSESWTLTGGCSCQAYELSSRGRGEMYKLIFGSTWEKQQLEAVEKRKTLPFIAGLQKNNHNICSLGEAPLLNHRSNTKLKKKNFWFLLLANFGKSHININLKCLATMS